MDGGLNTYNYVFGNPLILTDQFGLCGTGACVAAAATIIYRAMKSGKSMKQAQKIFQRWKKQNKNKIDKKNKEFKEKFKDEMNIAKIAFGACMEKCMRNSTLTNICRVLPEDLGGQDVGQVSICATICALKTGYDRRP